MSTKVANTISAFVHDENLETLKKLKLFLEEKMDDTDEVNDMIDEFTSTHSLTKVKGSKNIKVSGDKPKRTRKPTFYNHWLGERLRTFSEEQKQIPQEDRIGKNKRMKIIADEWKEFKKDTDAFDEAKARWEENSSCDEEERKPEKKKQKKSPKKQKKQSKFKKVEVSDSDSDSDDENNSPTAINSDSDEEEE